MKGEARHERIREFRRWKQRRVETSHRFQLVVTVREEDFDLLRGLGHGSINQGMQAVLRHFRDTA